MKTAGGMLPLGSKPLHSSNIILIAPPLSRRVKAFQATLADLGRSQARVISYLDLMAGQVHLAEVVQAGDIVRFDSSGEDISTELAFIERGGTKQNAEATAIAEGEIAPMRAWYAGFSAVLHELDQQLQQAAPHRRMQNTDHILSMFDKAATHAKLQAAGVPVPQCLPQVHSCAELFAEAQKRGWSRVFVKLNYGSGGSGAVALQWSGRRILATTTVRMQGGRLFNSRHLMKYQGWAEIHALIDGLAKHRIHTEQWIPKASFGGGPMDLRVVTIGGRAQHTLVRVGKGPITNLHLGNERGELAAFLEALGPQRWQAIKDTCAQALAAFPNALYAGIDVLLTPSFKRHFILEMNAFGDYHRGILVDGLDTYGAELLMLEGQMAEG